MESVTLGGDRLGSGKKQKVYLKNYERSTHDLGYVWRSTMSSGTLVPFLNQVGLPGDTFDIDLNVDIKTHPTIGPLFGSYKVQLDVFMCPVRLYQGLLHMNASKIGLKMDTVKLPVMEIFTDNASWEDNYQINPSSLIKYLGISGVGREGVIPSQDIISREFNATSLLSYWDIYKNYYANQVEEIGAFIHNPMNKVNNKINGGEVRLFGPMVDITVTEQANNQQFESASQTVMTFVMDGGEEPDYSQLKLYVSFDGAVGPYTPYLITELFEEFYFNEVTYQVTCAVPTALFIGDFWISRYSYTGAAINPYKIKPQIETFDLANIDQMRVDILKHTGDPTPFKIDGASVAPYGSIFQIGNYQGGIGGAYSLKSSQEGLGLKTYQSDLFNNWVDTEWIEGTNGINEITKVDTSSGAFTIDSLVLAEKVYKMLNRIAVSGGTYDDWLNSVYTHERRRGVENPVYMGGLIRELAFQEVVSNSGASESSSGQGVNQPLGTLAGRGTLTSKNKGGKIRVACEEVCMIMGIISLTPRVDYSQGNDFYTDLKTMDDFHKPQLDQIGFQDLSAELLAWWTTEKIGPKWVKQGVGKQPAWLNYMTNVNKCYGNFADQYQQMFMTLNRRYERGTLGIKDLTTYIDPSKYNNIFADARLDAQNFWAQIGVDITARRKMSAKLMPNL